jgi:hypothetical protein
MMRSMVLAAELGMKRAKNQVAGFGCRDGQAYSFQVAHLPYQDNASGSSRNAQTSGILAMKVWVWGTDLALADQAFFTVMHKLNRIFNGQDVPHALFHSDD